jgi:hypothetical protein
MSLEDTIKLVEGLNFKNNTMGLMIEIFSELDT